MERMMGASAQPGIAPRRDDSSPSSLFSLVWMVVSYIFAINLFVGVCPDASPPIAMSARTESVAVCLPACACDVCALCKAS